MKSENRRHRTATQSDTWRCAVGQRSCASKSTQNQHRIHSALPQAPFGCICHAVYPSSNFLNQNPVQSNTDVGPPHVVAVAEQLRRATEQPDGAVSLAAPQRCFAALKTPATLSSRMCLKKAPKKCPKKNIRFCNYLSCSLSHALEPESHNFFSRRKSSPVPLCCLTAPGSIA
jgi:hypothetical protein